MTDQKPIAWFDVSKKRLAYEVLELRRRHPQFTLYRSSENDIRAQGVISDIPPGIIAPPLCVEIICPAGYPAVAPKVRVISPDLSSAQSGHRFHLWSDRSICFVRPSDWDISYCLADVVDKLEDWYFNYVAVTSGLAREMGDVGRVSVEQGGGG